MVSVALQELLAACNDLRVQLVCGKWINSLIHLFIEIKRQPIDIDDKISKSTNNMR
jgi:ADP-heptose:LPS heptosyltransferase